MRNQKNAGKLIKRGGGGKYCAERLVQHIGEADRGLRRVDVLRVTKGFSE